MEERLNYYLVGTVDKPVMSNSSISYLEPSEGGSIQKYLGFFKADTEKKQSLSLDNGKIIHKYQENPSEFVVSDIVKPTEMWVEIVENLFNNLKKIEEVPNYFADINTAITGNLKSKD